MSIEKDKQAEEPIHFNELFRKARRNALFWAAITFLLPFGSVAQQSDGTQGKIGLSPVLRQLEFDHAALIVASLAVLGFMALGFLRASSDLRVKNSTVLVKDRLDEANGLFATLKNEASEARTKIARAIQKVVEHQTSIDRHRLVLDQALNGIVGELPPVTNGPIGGMDHFHQLEQRVLNKIPIELEHIHKFYEAHYTEMISWAKDRAETIAKRFNETLEGMEIPGSPLQMTASVDTAVVEALSRTGKQIDKLREFSDQLDQSQQRWHKGFDINLTWTAIGAAVFIATVFLIDAALPAGRYIWPFG